MSKITALFKELKATGKKGLIPFITAGDPDPKLTVELMHALVRGGSSVIELGVPFSDPMADGPVIQRSSERALTQGVTLHSCLEMVKEFRKKDADTPVVLMGYANPVEQMGADRCQNSFWLYLLRFHARSNRCLPSQYSRRGQHHPQNS